MESTWAREAATAAVMVGAASSPPGERSTTATLRCRSTSTPRQSWRWPPPPPRCSSRRYRSASRSPTDGTSTEVIVRGPPLYKRPREGSVPIQGSRASSHRPAERSEGPILLTRETAQRTVPDRGVRRLAIRGSGWPRSSRAHVWMVLGSSSQLCAHCGLDRGHLGDPQHQAGGDVDGHQGRAQDRG